MDTEPKFEKGDKVLVQGRDITGIITANYLSENREAYNLRDSKDNTWSFWEDELTLIKKYPS